MNSIKEVSPNLLILTAIKNRLKQPNQTVNQKLNNQRSGLAGEQSLNYFLKLQEHKFLTIHNLYIQQGLHSFQTDKLLLMNFLHLIIEIKNHTGTITFQPEIGQMTQIIGNNRKPYAYPIEQAETQAMKLRAFLRKNNVPVPPIEFLVVFTNKNAILETHDGSPIDKRIIKPYALRNKMNELIQKYKNNSMNINIQETYKLLLEHNVPYHIQWLQKLNLTAKDFQPGVFCPSCGFKPAHYKWGRWHCENCHFISKDAHILALKDFFLIFGPQITSRQAQYWLQAPTQRIARQILINTGCRKLNQDKNRVYVLPFKMPVDFLYLIEDLLR